MQKSTWIVAYGLCAWVGLVSPAAALPEFKKAFDEKYVRPADDSQFTNLSNQAKCNVCHVQGGKKEVRNAYGEALANLIQGNAKQRLAAAAQAGNKAAEIKKLLEELDAAFAKSEADKSPSGETYGERLKQHKLPAP